MIDRRTVRLVTRPKVWHRIDVGGEAGDRTIFDQDAVTLCGHGDADVRRLGAIARSPWIAAVRPEAEADDIDMIDFRYRGGPEVHSVADTGLDERATPLP